MLCTQMCQISSLLTFYQNEMIWIQRADSNVIKLVDDASSCSMQEKIRNEVQKSQYKIEYKVEYKIANIPSG